MSNWKFDQPENAAAFTTKEILSGSNILYVFHDIDDHGWQFFGSEAASGKNAAVVSMRSIVNLDNSVEEVAYIEPGWKASRRFRGDTWKIEKR